MDQPAEGGGEGKMCQGVALLRGLSSGNGSARLLCWAPCEAWGHRDVEDAVLGLRELRCQCRALTQNGTGDTNSTAALSVRHLPRSAQCPCGLETVTAPILGMRRLRLSDVK